MHTHVFVAGVCTTADDGQDLPAGQGANKMETGYDVLVLDDEPVVGDRLKPVIEADGHRVEVFVDPREALKRVEEKTFDIVVTDIRMENVSGLEVLDKVVAKDARTKVITVPSPPAGHSKDAVTKPFCLDGHERSKRMESDETGLLRLSNAVP